MRDGRPYNDISLLETADDLYTTDGNAAPACLPSKGFYYFIISPALNSGAFILPTIPRYKYS